MAFLNVVVTMYIFNHLVMLEFEAPFINVVFGYFGIALCIFMDSSSTAKYGRFVENATRRRV